MDAAHPRLGVVTLCLLFLLCGAGSATADPPTIEERIDVLEQAHAEAIQDLFRWSLSCRLNGTANAVARELLVLVPDHEKARRWLGFKRRDGRWIPPESTKKRRDWNRAAREKYPTRRAALLEPILRQYETLLASLSHPEVVRARRDLLASALTHWPDHEPFRRANGEVREGARWILLESARTGKTRPALEKKAKALLRSTSKGEASAVPDYVKGLGVAFRWACTCGKVTAVSATSEKEAERAAAHCAAVDPLFQQALGIEMPPPERVVVLLGREGRDVRRVARGLDLPRDVVRELSRYSGFWLPVPTSTLLVADDRGPERLDSCLRYLVYRLLDGTYGGFGRMGWAGEGIGVYLTWLLCDTRLSVFVRKRERTDPFGPHRPDVGGDRWMAQARQLLARGQLHELAYLVAVDLNAMKQSHAIAAYAFAVYLITGWPDEVTPFLRATNGGRDTAQAAVEVLAYELPALDERWRRWLEETR